MAFKAVLGIFLILCLTRNHVGADEEKMEKKEDYESKKGGDMMKKLREGMDMMKDGMKNDMMGKPMMCYSKKKMMQKGDYGKDEMSKMLLSQASRLLGVVMMETEGSDDLDVSTLREVTDMLQRIVEGGMGTKKEDGGEQEEETKNTELGMELLGIVKNLIGDGDQNFPGVSVTVKKGEEADEMDASHSAQPMHDTPMAPPAPPALASLLQNFDLASLGLDMKGLIELVNDPGMSIMIEGLGLGPLARMLQDPTIAPLLEQLDLETVMGLLQTGKLVNADGGVDLETILELVQNVQEGEGDATLVPPTEPKKPAKDEGMKETDDKMKTKKDHKDEKKEMEEKMKDEEYGDMDKKEKMKDGKRTMQHGKKSLKQMRDGKEKAIMEAFDKIMALAGIQGAVDEENIIESTLKAMQFIMNADEATLEKLMGAIEGVDLDIFEMMGGKRMGGDDKEGYEMICYPMKDEDMKKYGMMKGEGRYEDKSMMTGMKKDKDCNYCGKDMGEMKKMMKNLIHEELGKVFNDLSSGMQGMSFVAPEIKTMLEKMSNGGLSAVLEVEGKELTLDDDVNKWTEWSAWDSCSVTCGEGVSVRSRMCTEEYISAMDKSVGECEQSQSRGCNMMKCAGEKRVGPSPIKDRDNKKETKAQTIDKWGPWTPWDPCTQTCGGGVTVRSRMCKSEYMPPMENAAEYAACEASESRNCNIQPCPTETPVARKWGEWTEWSACTAQCSGGTSYRVRSCLDGLSDCSDIGSRMCNTKPCRATIEIPQQWFGWEEWSPCSVTCGTGTSTRRRQCVTKSASSSCEQVQSKSCFQSVCPVPTSLPLWQEWTQWSPCTVTCGDGISIRRRFCNDPTREGCTDIGTRTCSNRQCTLAGVWGVWSDWSACTASCGGGTRNRARGCRSGLCIGEATMTESCNRQACQPTFNPRPTSVYPAGGCPPSQYRQLRIGGYCVVFHGRESRKMSFTDYRSYCQARGGDIVRMTNVDKWVQITYWLKSIMENGYSDKAGMPWIGATDMGHRGQWRHPSSPNDNVFTIWSRGEPKNTGIDQCAVLNVMNGHAYGEKCTSGNYAVCEYRSG